MPSNFSSGLITGLVGGFSDQWEKQDQAKRAEKQKQLENHLKLIQVAPNDQKDDLWKKMQAEDMMGLTGGAKGRGKGGKAGDTPNPILDRLKGLIFGQHPGGAQDPQKTPPVANAAPQSAPQGQPGSQPPPLQTNAQNGRPTVAGAGNADPSKQAAIDELIAFQQQPRNADPSKQPPSPASGQPTIGADEMGQPAQQAAPQAVQPPPQDSASVLETQIQKDQKLYEASTGYGKDRALKRLEFHQDQLLQIQGASDQRRREVKEERDDMIVDIDQMEKSGQFTADQAAEARDALFGVKATAYNLQLAWARVPGSTELKPVRIDPRKPGLVLDAGSGEQLFGAELVNPAIVTAQIRQSYYGDFGNFYRAGLGQGLNDEQAKKQAGEMVYKKYGVNLGATEQNIAIKGELTGYSGAPDIPKLPGATTPPGKPAPQTAAPAAGGPGTVPTASTTPSGGPALFSAPLGKAVLSQAASDPGLDANAWDYGLTGNLPSVSTLVKQRIMYRWRQIFTSIGMDPADIVALKGMTKANLPALVKMTWLDASVRQFEGTLERNLKLAETLNKKYERGNVKFANRIVAFIRGETSDPAVNNFMQQIHAMAPEYAKIMAGSTSAAGATVSGTAEAQKMFDVYLSTHSLQSFFDDVIRPDMANRKAALADGKRELLDSLRGSNAVQAVSGGATPPPATPAPAGPARGGPPPAPAPGRGDTAAPKPGSADQYLQSIGHQ